MTHTNVSMMGENDPALLFATAIRAILLQEDRPNNEKLC